MSEVVDSAIPSKPPISLQTVKNILTKLHNFIEQNSIDSFALQILDKENSTKKAGCLFFEAEVEVFDVLKGIENEGAAIVSADESAAVEQPKEGSDGNVGEKEEIKVDDASTDENKKSDGTDQVKESEVNAKKDKKDENQVKEDESKKEAKEEKKPALKKVNKFKEPTFGKKKGKPALDWMKKKNTIKAQVQDKKEESDAGVTEAKQEEPAAKEETDSAANAEVKVEEKAAEKEESTKEKTEEKTEEKPEEKPEVKAEEQKEETTEEKVEEKTDAKVDGEKADEKNEGKTEGETEEKVDEQSEHKAEETIEEKTEDKAEEENSEKAEEKTEIVAAEETQEVKPEEESADNPEEKTDVTTSEPADEKTNEQDKQDQEETEEEKRRRLSSHFDNLEQQGNIGFTITPKITIQEESMDLEENPEGEEILPFFKLKPFYEMPKFKFPGAEENDSDDEGNVSANEEEKKEKQYGYHVRVSGELDDLNEDEMNDEEVFERSGSFTYEKFFESYTTRHPTIEKTGDLSDGVDDAELDYINQGRTYHSRKARKLRLSRLKEENAIEAVIDLVDSIRYKPSSIGHGKHSSSTRYRTSSSSSIISF